MYLYCAHNVTLKACRSFVLINFFSLVLLIKTGDFKIHFSMKGFDSMQ